MDRFYILRQSRLGIYHEAYFIHRYPVGSDHSQVQLEILIENGEVRKTIFKWNMIHLQDACDILKASWKKLFEDASFFSKMRYINRIYMQLSKKNTIRRKNLTLKIT